MKKHRLTIKTPNYGVLDKLIDNASKLYPSLMVEISPTGKKLVPPEAIAILLGVAGAAAWDGLKWLIKKITENKMTLKFEREDIEWLIYNYSEYELKIPVTIRKITILNDKIVVEATTNVSKLTILIIPSQFTFECKEGAI